MNILHCTPGTGSFYCGTCIRDNALVQALKRAGHAVTMAPMYLPLITDEAHATEDTPIFFGGVNVYLQQKSALFRHTPRWVDGMFDARWLLHKAAQRAGMTKASELGELMISMLKGEEGRQAKELDRMVSWLAARPRPDVICLSNALLVGLARRLGAVLKAPVVCTLQGEDTFLDSLPEPYRAQAWALLAERAQDVAAFVAISRYYGGLMQTRMRLAPEKVTVVYNGISLEGFTLPVAGPAAAARKQSIGYLARIHPGKGLKTLVQAFILLRKNSRHAQVELKVAGSLTAAEEPFLRELRGMLQAAGLESAAIFSPNIDRAGKIAFLQSLSVFSVPATYGEAFGLYVLEALAAGVPVVQPEHAAFPELIAATGGGLLCKPDDPADLAARLAVLLEDPAQAQALGAAGRQAVVNRFNVERMAGEVLAVFEAARRMAAPAVPGR